MMALGFLRKRTRITGLALDRIAAQTRKRFRLGDEARGCWSRELGLLAAGVSAAGYGGGVLDAAGGRAPPIQDFQNPALQVTEGGSALRLADAFRWPRREGFGEDCC